MNVSVVIPAYNAQRTIKACLDSLTAQVYDRDQYEVIVVDDGSTDGTTAIVSSFPGVRLIKQSNQGPAAARNNGAGAASGGVILFTDSDCEASGDWISRMIEPFEREPGLAGVKGAYRTKQTKLVARFVQLEYEDKYDLLSKDGYIDFIDTYSAGFNKEIFFKYGGYDTTFKVACAEDVELSYRMANGGEKMRFIPGAVVYHIHPDSWFRYFQKKYKFAYWRILALKKNPNKAVRDSHTPQLMKLQILFFPAWLLAMASGLISPRLVWLQAGVWALFLVSTAPFTFKAVRKDPAAGLIAPVLLLGRSVSQFFGVLNGTFRWLLR